MSKLNALTLVQPKTLAFLHLAAVFWKNLYNEKNGMKAEHVDKIVMKKTGD